MGAVRYGRLVAAALFVPACACAVTLEALEARIGQAARLREADGQMALLQARHELAKADGGARLFGAMSIEHGRNASRPERYLIENTQNGTVAASEQVLTPHPAVRERASGQVGIRIPLFGSRTQHDELVRQAGGAVELQRLRRKTAELEVVKALRYSYAEAYFLSREGELARRYGALLPATRQYLDKRRDARRMVSSEHARLLSTFGTATQYEAEAASAVAKALATIAAITGTTPAADMLEEPVLRVGCLTAGKLTTSMDVHPDLLYYGAEAAQLRRAVDAAAAGAVEGTLSLSHGGLREFGGRSGYSSAIAVDVSIPLELARWRAAQRGVAVADFQRAQGRLDDRRAEFRAAAEHAVLSRQAAVERLAAARQRLDAEDDGIRVAQARLDGGMAEAMEALIGARALRFDAARAVLQAQLALSQRQADLLGLGSPCAAGSEAGAGPAGAPPVAADDGTVAGQADRAVVAGPPAGGAVQLGWYAWHLFRRIASEPAGGVLNSLPPADRLLLSLTRSEIDAIRAGGAERRRLADFLQSAHHRGLRVELLLGEPLWALPQFHPQLLQLVADLASLSFDGLHLDIERSQLPEAQRRNWQEGLVTLVGRIRQASTAPLGVSLHRRDTTSGLIKSLAASGVGEITVMYYSTQARQVGDQMHQLLSEHPQLQWSLAQSVERSLPAAESYASLGPARALAALRQLGAPLASQPNFRGIVVQSIDEFQEHAHEN